jgi:thiazole synthase
MKDIFKIGSHTFSSRLLVGTGKYKNFQETKEAIISSGADVVTVAIRRTNIGQKNNEENLLDIINPDSWTILPNTAGCYTVDDAIRTCNLARELLDGHNLVKLEVLDGGDNLLPEMDKTLKAARHLIEDNFEVMVYCNDDPSLCLELDEMGCVAVMPLASPIGSGQGITNPDNIVKIIENSSKPIIIDAGIGCPSDACFAMELGCDGVLMNTAIAESTNPILMANAMKLAVESGRNSYLAGRMKIRDKANPSSPISGISSK